MSEALDTPHGLLKAEMPSFPVANSQQAMNHTVKGVRVRSKIVPAVTDVRQPHAVHIVLPSPKRHPFSPAHSGQIKPLGHRNHSR